MNTLYEEAMRTWGDPHARHALLVHAPVVLGVLGILPLLLLALTGFRSAALKEGVILWFLLASGGAWLARDAGLKAEESQEKREPALSTVEHAALERHEDLGKLAWIWPLIPAGFGVFMLARGRKTQVAAGVLTLFASVGVAAVTALTGHTGGRLVYLYGLGVPERGAPAEGTELKATAPAPSATPAVPAAPVETPPAPKPEEPKPEEPKPEEPTEEPPKPEEPKPDEPPPPNGGG